MIHPTEHIIKTRPYRVITNKGTRIEFMKYIKDRKVFIPYQVLSDDCRRAFYVCRDQNRNLMFVDDDNIYFIHAGRIRVIDFKEIFELQGPATTDDIDDMIKMHNTITIR